MNRILEALTLSSSCSIDAFIASFAYGSNKIKIPFISNQIINIVCSTILGVSLLVGSIIRNYLPRWLTVTICFIILFTLGIIKLFDSIIKEVIKKCNNLNKEVHFSFFNFTFILKLYSDPEEADVDSSRDLSSKEAAFLALSLSLDGLAAGFGAALGNVSGWIVFLSSLITNMLTIYIGCYLGNRITKKVPFNISWLSGIILITLAIIKLL